MRYPHISNIYMPAAISTRNVGELFNVFGLCESLTSRIDACLYNLTVTQAALQSDQSLFTPCLNLPGILAQPVKQHIRCVFAKLGAAPG